MEVTVRIGQYLVDRSYFTPAQIPQLVGALTHSENDDWQEHLTAYIRTLVARHIGITEDEDADESLAFFSSPQRISESIADYVRTTDQYAEVIATWQQERQGQPDLERPEPAAVMEPILADLIAFHIQVIDSNDRVNLALACETEPVWTNGEWDPEESRLQWSSSIRDGAALLAMFFVCWTTPSETFQMKHFGRVLLSGKTLGEYALWCAALTEDERREWDSFLAQIVPDGSARASIESFQFTVHDRQDAESGKARPAKQLLLAALENGAE